jgi:hypothetical protein
MGGYHRHLNGCRLAVGSTNSNTNNLLPERVFCTSVGDAEPRCLIPTAEAEGIGNRKTIGNTATANFMASMLAMAEGRHPHPSGEEEATNQPPSGWYVVDPMVFVADTLPQCDFVTKHRFTPPKDFSSEYLRNVVNTNGHVRFHQNAWQQLMDKEKSSIGLFKLLKGKELYLFDDIQKWSAKGDQGLEAEIYGRTKAISDLQKFYGFDALLPLVREVTLPHTIAKVNLTTFSFG